MTASLLYAQSQGRNCHGREECHFCAAPAGRQWTYYPPMRLVGERDNTRAARPSSCFLCNGCSLWRAQRRTIHWLHGGFNGLSKKDFPNFKDRQCAMNHSWLVMPTAAVAIDLDVLRLMPDDSPLYRFLLKPTSAFFLSILDGPREHNHLHLCRLNNHCEVKATTTFLFTVNSIVFEYTPYDLKDGMANGPDGRPPGVQMLLRLFGQPQPPPPKPPRKQGVRDWAEHKPIKEVHVASGQVAMMAVKT